MNESKQGGGGEELTQSFEDLLPATQSREPIVNQCDLHAAAAVTEEDCSIPSTC